VKTDDQVVEADEAVPADAWRRMHPVTPALKGWKAIVAVVAFASYQFADDVRAASDLLAGRGWLFAVGLVLLVGVVGFAYSGLAWRMTRYAVTDEAVHYRSGLVFRQQRQARLDRLQAVDVVQPLLARLFGLADLRLEVAGGSGSAVSLAYLREPDAQALRSELLALAAGLRRPTTNPSAADAPAVPLPGGEPTAAVPTGRVPGFEEAPEREVYTVPMSRLLVSTLRSAGVVGLVVMLVAVVAGALIAQEAGPLFALLPAALGFVGALWGRVNSGAGFRAAWSPDGIRLRHGLTEQRAQTVPPGRVQAVRLTQSLWWRGPDWWRVQINVAGYGTGDDAARATVLHPVATRQEAAAALWLVLPDLGVEDPWELINTAMSGMDDDGGFITSPRSARWLDPIGWRRRGVRVTRTALISRSGRLVRNVDVVPHERTQSLGLDQGPLQRRLGLASFVVHSTPGPVSPRVDHLEAKAAAALLDEQAERARTARASAGPELWMRGTA